MSQTFFGDFANIWQFQALLLLIFVSSLTEAQYEDVRCKCVCPKESKSNGTKRNVFVEAVEPEECTCQHLVKREESYCLRCQCKYEARNTTLIKVVIMFIIVVIGTLCLYLIYLAIDAKRKPLQLSVTVDEVQQNLRQRRQRRLGIDEKLAKWKRTVAQQRRNIYDTRTMLS